MSPKSTEQRAVAVTMAILYLFLCVTFVWFLFAYFQKWRPSAKGHVSRGMDVGFPLAICIGIVHFLRRSLQSWRSARSD